MSRVVPLSDSKIKSLKVKAKEYKVADGDGLYLHVRTTGSKIWKLRYKNTTKSLGKYPRVSLSAARKLREEIRAKVANNEKVTTSKENVVTFEEVCNMYFEHNNTVSDLYIKQNKAYLENHYYHVMRNLELDEIEAITIIEIIKTMNAKKIHETIRRTGSLLNRIFKYAVTLQYMKRNPMNDIDLSVIVSKQKKRNFAHIIDEGEIKELLLAIDGYMGDLSTKTALQLMPYVFLRPANIRGAKWEQIDFDKKLWTIPAVEMKMERDHIVPLTDKMIEILKRVEGNGSAYVFPSPLSRSRKLSENTLNNGLARLGYKGVMTSHGFRHMASTILHEHIYMHGVSSDVIEMQLAHVESNAIKGAYNKARYMKDRVELMGWWSDWIDAIKK